MPTSKLALVVALACGGGLAASIAPPATAQVGLSITVGRPPPPLRYEVVPPPRPGYVWAPGYWNWSGHSYAWVGGTWYRGRPGYVYASPHWVHHGNRWEMQRARWNHDPHWRGGHDNGRHHGDHDHGHDNGGHYGDHDRGHDNGGHHGDHDHHH